MGMGELHWPSGGHDQDFIGIHDRVQSVGYREDGAVFEIFTDGLLDQRISTKKKVKLILMVQ